MLFKNVVPNYQCRTFCFYYAREFPVYVFVFFYGLHLYCNIIWSFRSTHLVLDHKMFPDCYWNILKNILKHVTSFWRFALKSFCLCPSIIKSQQRRRQWAPKPNTNKCFFFYGCVCVCVYASNMSRIAFCRCWLIFIQKEIENIFSYIFVPSHPHTHRKHQQSITHWTIH